MHQTEDLNDGYMGSGKYLKRAIEKYGPDYFRKEYMCNFDNEDDMKAKEAELVNEEFVNRSDTYNICEGGKGGFGYINANGLGISDNQKSAAKKHMGVDWNKKRKHKWDNDEEFRQSLSKKLSQSAKGNQNWLGKKHTEETKKRMRKSKNVGDRNSQFGSMWITNGTENKKIKSLDTIPDGWYKGRKMTK